MFLNKDFYAKFLQDYFNKICREKRIKENIDNAVGVKALSRMKVTLDASGVYKWREVKDFSYQYMRGESAERLSLSVDIMVKRFNYGLDKDEEKAEFKIKAIAFVNTYLELKPTHYAEIKKWECLFLFLKLLVLKLNTKNPDIDMLDIALDDFVGVEGS